MTSTESAELRRSPLHDQHVALGAKLGDFNGWLMPIEYSGTLAEHAAVREAVALFDVSHMGKVRVHGTGAADFLNTVLTNDLNNIGDGQAQYSLLCNEAGGVIDDLIVYRWASNECFIVPNAGNAAEVIEVLRSLAPQHLVIDDHHFDHGIIAVQGPKSAQLLARVGLPAEHDYMSMVAAEFAGHPVVVARTGYTGERGYELVVPIEVIASLWTELLSQGESLGVVAAGLGARDTLRLEMGYPLHGHELSVDISPIQARVGWAVGWDKPQFQGRAALLEQREVGPKRVLRALKANARGIPRADCQVSVNAEVVGVTTSGTFSPTLGQGIALALIDASVSEGDLVQVDVRGRPLECTVVKAPFVAPSTR